MALISASYELISPKTATETVTFSLRASDVPARLTATGLAGAEVIPVKTLEGPNGTVEGTPYKDGAAISLKATDPVISLWAPGPYKIVKPVTAGASGLYLAKGQG